MILSGKSLACCVRQATGPERPVFSVPIGVMIHGPAQLLGPSGYEDLSFMFECACLGGPDSIVCGTQCFLHLAIFLLFPTPSPFPLACYLQDKELYRTLSLQISPFDIISGSACGQTCILWADGGCGCWSSQKSFLLCSRGHAATWDIPAATLPHGTSQHTLHSTLLFVFGDIPSVR